MSREGAGIRHEDDLELAQRCATGEVEALKTFQEKFGDTIGGVVRRFAKEAVEADELRQLLNDKLFVGETPKIANYSGKGFLENWLRVTATRLFTDRARARRSDTHGGDALLDVADGADDVELSFLKRHYRAHFKEAFGAAVASLTSRERNALRHSVVQGLSIDQIAALYHVHRATAARRVASARKALLSATRTALMSRLSVDPDELDSVMGLIQSRVDVSIRRLLGSHDTERDTE